MITYSFFAQGHLPQSRTMHDLSVLRNAVFPTGLDLHFQIQNNKESAEGLCSQLRSTLKRLKGVNDLPSWDKLVDGGQEMLDKRQEDINSLLKLYMDQATKDYHTSKLDKERLLLNAHLSQQQSIQVLELHGRLAESMDKSRLVIEKALGDRLEDTNEKLDKAIRLIMKQNQDVISNMPVEATKNITEFDVHDMQALMASQKEALQNVLDQNAMLAGQNSELRMHLSFVPVEYRDFITKLQKTDNPKYRDQRRNPKVIVPESFHKDGYANDFTIELEDAPLAHSAVQFCLRDAQYATLGEARRGMERGVKLRDYVQTHVSPKSAHLAKSAPPGLPPQVPDTSSASQSRTPLDQRLTSTGQAQIARQFTAAGALNDGHDCTLFTMPVLYTRTSTVYDREMYKLEKERFEKLDEAETTLHAAIVESLSPGTVRTINTSTTSGIALLSAFQLVGKVEILFSTPTLQDILTVNADLQRPL